MTTSQHEIYPVDFTPTTDETINSGLFTPLSGSLDTQNYNGEKPKKRKTSIEHFNNIVPPLRPIEMKNGVVENNIQEGMSLYDSMSILKDESVLDDFNIQKLLIRYFTSIRNGVKQFQYKTSYFITNTLSFKNFVENDVDVLKIYITWFFSIVVCCYIVYNFFYIMVYTDELTKQKVKTLSSELNRGLLHRLSAKYSLIAFLKQFLESSFTFPEYIYKVFIDWIPEFIVKIFNPAVIFVLLFYALIFIFYNLSEFLCTTIIELLNVNTTNPLVCIVYGLVVIMFINNFVNSSKKPEEMVMKNIPIVNVMYYIGYLILFLIDITITPLIGIILSISIVMMISFFSLGVDFFRKIANVNKFMEDSLNRPDYDSFCDPPTFMQNLIATFNKVFKFLYKYVFHSAFIFMVLYSMKDFTHNIESETLKLLLVTVNMLILMVISTLVFVDFTSEKENITEYFVGKT
jgi:hypothetical protein